MKKAIIGYTGFVGGNIIKEKKFDYYYNSKNIGKIRNCKFDELYISGVSAVKWVANKEPKKDWSDIQKLIDDLITVKANKVVLISTVDVYPNPIGVDEDSEIVIGECQPYGKHRLLFEKEISKIFDDFTVVRLPGLFGEGLKKNIIFDFLNNNMIDKIDSRNEFQFYDLSKLVRDINVALMENIKLINFAVEPISVREVASICGINGFDNKLDMKVVNYDFKTKYCNFYGLDNGYIYSKKQVLEQLRQYVNGCRKV
ncbi:hypothetical protein [Endozoicomonas sp. ALE010]|uniref:hypothetical protein n=1 Tax=Endozoicomonas sp. ALE010 TaxID=3403081 RepID=UPI003BB691C5